MNTADIAVGAVTSSELASFAVGPNKIAAGVVGASEIAKDAVGEEEIAAGAVGASEIAPGAVGRSALEGTEVRLYEVQRGCGSGPTFQATCTTNFCSPVPVPLFNFCSGDCGSPAPVTCENTLKSYLLSPSIQ